MTRSMLPCALGLALLSLMASACSDEPSAANNSLKDESKDPNISLRRGILADVGQQVILKTYAELLPLTEALGADADAWAKAPQDQDARMKAQASWRAVMRLWQRAEVMIVGPAGLMSEVAGGQDLRDELYSWPLTNPCRVDVELVAKTYDTPEKLSAARVNVRGLDALEYLLFVQGAGNACTSQTPINAQGSWSALGDQEVLARRAAYAAQAAALVARDAKRLHDAWSAQGQDFLAQWTNAGQGSTRYATTQEALNALSDAMFYVEKDTKDMKLGPPLGLMGCTASCAVDLSKLESQHAAASLDHIKANLAAFELLYRGGDQPQARGFDDLLRALGQGALAEAFEAELASAKAALDAIEGDLSVALIERPAQVQAAFDAMRVMLTRFKTEFIAVLGLEIPKRAEGDND